MYLPISAKATWLSFAGSLAVATLGLATYIIKTASNFQKAYQPRRKTPNAPVSIPEDCPYEYLLNIYGKHHFAGFVHKLDPTLKTKNLEKWQTVVEIMDRIHFCLILVDDITDRSPLRRSKPTAHTIFGPDETANRAYLVLTRIMNETAQTQPQLIPFLLQCLEEVLEGQDISLVWRRDGLTRLPIGQKEREDAYRRCAWLKTGALFRLVGQLVSEGREWDEVMSKVEWYSQLQNDLKNLYSADYALAKGALAEDLRNGEFSYPIILALEQPSQGHLVEEALASDGDPRSIDRALEVVRSEEVRGRCLRELKALEGVVGEWVEPWGRREKL